MTGSDAPSERPCLAALTAHMQAGVAIIDRQGLFVDANHHYSRLHGHGRGEIAGRHFTDLTPPRLRAPMMRLHEALFSRGHEDPSYWQLPSPEGGEVYVRAQSVLYRCARGTPYRVATLIDMTEHRRLERDMERERAVADAAISRLHASQNTLLKARKMSSLDDLLCGVAHELNTPIGVALTATTHLERKLAETRAALAGGTLTREDLDRFLAATGDTLDLLRGSTERAGMVVESFRQVSAGTGQEDLATIALRHHVEAAVHALMPAPDGEGPRIEVSVPEDLRLTTCPAALGRVLTALLTNAIDHGLARRQGGRPGGHQGGRLTVWAGRAGDSVALTVRDNGAGIAPADLPRVFDPFYRGDSASNSRHKGLGLFMVHNLVTGVLGGSISVESVLGHHTAFRLTLPHHLSIH